MGSSQFYFCDTGNEADEADEDDNNGFAARRTLLGLAPNKVFTEIPLNRCSFFESLDNQLLPNTRVTLEFNLETDDNLIWRKGGDDCQIVVTKMRLVIPRLIFNGSEQKLYNERFLAPRKWTYLKAKIEVSTASQQKSGIFKVTSGIIKPRGVFIWVLNINKFPSQTENPFLYNTLSFGNDKTIESCYLEVANGNKYPENAYYPKTEISRIFRDIHRYSIGENEYQMGGTLLNRGNFESLFPFLYFDLKNQDKGIKDRVTKLDFHYNLSDVAGNDYVIYALILREEDIEIYNENGKTLLR